jgi:hypothetical protein
MRGEVAPLRNDLKTSTQQAELLLHGSEIPRVWRQRVFHSNSQL